MACERIALVLAGGGARGAYEAGALSIVLPELERRGQRPTMYVGTSVGSLNAVALAAWHALPAGEAVERLVALWSAVDKSQVIKRILFPSGPLAIARYAGELLSVPGLRLPSILDPSPLRANLERWIDWDGLHASVAEGAVDAVAAVTTSTRSGRTVVFAEVPSPEGRRLHRSHEIAYVLATLGADHVSASAAIPLLFPPVRVTSPAAAQGWYVDGGTRLNAPIKPALDLGADRLVVVATDSIAGPVLEREEDAALDEPPDFAAGLGHLLEGVLVDPLIRDMRALGAINAFHTRPGQEAMQLYRTVRDKPPYRRIPYVFVGPEARGRIGELASERFAARFGGVRGLRDPDFTLLSRLLGGESPAHGELLSLLFFESGFARELIALGREDARRWLAEPHEDGPWQIGPLASFVRPREWTAG
jgi:NTE family protein